MTYDRELRTEAAHALTHNSEVWADRGYAVVTAGGLSAGATDFELDVGPYDVLVGSTTQTSVGPTTLSVNAPAENPYWLVVYADSAGLQTAMGPEGEVFVGDQSVVASNADVREITSPAPPTLADIGPVTVLGRVLVTSSGVTNSLIDDRTFGGGRIADSLAFRSLDGQIDTGNLSEEAVTAAKIAAQAVESEKIASGAVGVDELAAALGTDDVNPVPGTTHLEAVSTDSLNSADLATAESGTVPTAQGDGSLTMGEAGGGRFSNLLDETTATASELELSGFTASDFKIVIVELENLSVPSESDSVKMRLDNDDSSNYAYNSVFGDGATSQEEFQIASPGDASQPIGGQIELTTGSNGRSFITAAKIGWQDWRVDALSQLIESGGGNYSTNATSIQIFGLDGGDEQTVRAYGVD